MFIYFLAWILTIFTAAFSTIFVTVQFGRAASSATASESVAASFASFAAASAEEHQAIGFRHTLRYIVRMRIPKPRGAEAQSKYSFNAFIKGDISGEMLRKYLTFAA